MTDSKTREFYDRVYLCTQEIGKIDCKRFDSFESADSYHTNTYKNRKTDESQNVFPTYNTVSTMLPMCKYVPEFLDKPILKFKLANMMYIKLSLPEEK